VFKFFKFYKIKKYIEIHSIKNTARQVKMMLKLNQKLNQRDHKLVSLEPNSRISPIKIYCTKHKTTHETSYYKYSRAITGLPCCGKQRQRDLLAGRLTVKTSARKHQTKWRKKLKQENRNRCFFTSLTTRNEAHHLFSISSFPKLANVPENGIIIDRNLHRKFHSWHGQKNPCTIDHLCKFIEFISDPTNIEEDAFFDSIRHLKINNVQAKLQTLKKRSVLLEKKMVDL
jgi:hypothetical protein